MDRTDAFRLLASADRQLVLHELVTESDPTPIERLSERVASRRHGVPPESVSDEQLDRAQVRLVHQHFPILRDRNVITVDWERNEVALSDGGDARSLFDAAAELEQWPPDDMESGLAT